MRSASTGPTGSHCGPSAGGCTRSARCSTGGRRGSATCTRRFTTPQRRSARLGLPPAGPQTEAAEHEQRLLAQRAARRQDPKLGGGVVEVKERTDAEQPVVLELAVEDAVHDDEAVARREPLEGGSMRGQELARRGHEAAVGEPGAGLL